MLFVIIFYTSINYILIDLILFIFYAEKKVVQCVVTFSLKAILLQVCGKTFFWD